MYELCRFSELVNSPATDLEKTSHGSWKDPIVAVTRYAAKRGGIRQPTDSSAVLPKFERRYDVSCQKWEMKSRTGTQNTRTCALWSNSALGSTHQQPTRGASRPELRAVRSARDTNDVQNVDRAQNSDNNAEVVASEWQLPPFCDCRKECRPQRSVGLGAGDPL